MQNKQRIGLIKLHKIQNFPQDSNVEGQTKDGKLTISGNFLEGETIEIQASKDGFIVMDPVEYIIKPTDNEAKIILNSVPGNYLTK